MDKNAIKKYAVWARRELIERVSQRALLYGISADAQADANAVIVNGQALDAVQQKQRKALIEQIREKGYEQVMEEVAYTWFNRFAALRFMEVNGYLPSHIRVFTDDDSAFKPQILTEAIYLELDGLDMEKVYALERENKKEELFKYLLIVQCNALSSILPGMFQKIEDYTELLLPDYLLREGSVIEQMVTQIAEEDWTDQVQIIGWLYQYYNTEPKDQVFADLKKNIKITKEKIPAATQLFTPDWIVHYMVENSLGRLWIEGHPDSAESLLPTEEEQTAYAAGERSPGDTKWHYYLEEAPQEPEVETQLKEIRKEYAALKPEEILCIDPCMGSGHILCVLFDALVRIYEDYGYTAREAAVSIVQNNLWGLDIDDRAAQLAYFAVMMKARQYDRRFFSRHIQPHVYTIAESNHVIADAVEYFCNGDAKLERVMRTIITELHDAKEYGSILTTTPQDWNALYARFDEIHDDISIYKDAALALEPLVQTAQALGQKYWITVTNPPYAGVSNLNADVGNYVKKQYTDSKADLFAVFMERCGEIVVQHGYQAMITQQSWMFQPTYTKLRKKLEEKTLINLIHLGARAFDEIAGEVVQTAAFVYRNDALAKYASSFKRLIEENGENQKRLAFYDEENRFDVPTENFRIIPNRTIAYWLSKNFTNVFKNKRIEEYAISDGQTKTGNNDLYMRFLWEVSASSIGKTCKWVLIAKGGKYRKWAGNIDMVIDWSKSARDHYRKDHVARIAPEYIWYRRGISWNHISSSTFSARILNEDCLFETAAPSIFFDSEDTLWRVLAFLNTRISNEILKVINPTLSTNVGDITVQPIIYDECEDKNIALITQHCVEISCCDWNESETSWDFQRHPLISVISKNRMLFDDIGNIDLAECYMCWAEECEERFQTLKSNEEELNRIFIDIYGLQDELTPDVADKDVTVRRFFDTKDDIPESMCGSAYALTKQDAVKSLISYAVGCMFGRYSIYKEGLMFAGESYSPAALEDKLNENVRQSAVEKHLGIKPQRIKLRNDMFLPDSDAIIPICDDEYFTDDIVGLFEKFIEMVYGANSLEENLRFIADALDTKGSTSREVIRNYFLNDFFKDHLKTYQKRPIYWLFDSGKKNGFKCLIYMHRYQPDTIARIRTDYVHEQQSRYRTAIADLEHRVSNSSASERVKLNKQLQKLQGQSEEVRIYEEKIHHLADQFIAVDLDDGVKVNYAKFQDVLAKIK